jgi:hypothetical protein
MHTDHFLRSALALHVAIVIFRSLFNEVISTLNHPDWLHIRIRLNKWNLCRYLLEL